MPMRFFTEELTRLMQSDHFPLGIWEERGQEYKAHLKHIQPQMPAALKQFSNHYFHDCIVTSVHLLPNQKVEISLEGAKTNRNTSRQVIGIHILQCSGVAKLAVDADVVGAYWSWEEVDLIDSGWFGLSVLLDGATQPLEIKLKNLKVSSTSHS